MPMGRRHSGTSAGAFASAAAFPAVAFAPSARSCCTLYWAGPFGTGGGPFATVGAGDLDGAGLLAWPSAGTLAERFPIPVPRPPCNKAATLPCAFIEGLEGPKEGLEGPDDEAVENCGLDPVLATLVRLTVDGLWFAEMHRYAPPDVESRERIIELIFNMTHGLID